MTAARRLPRGFTIIELMITLVILGIMVSLGLPSMRDLIASTKVKTAASDVFSSLILARSEAVKRNSSVEVVPNSTSNWGGGWSVRVVSSGEVMQVQDAITGDVTVSGPGSSLRYRGDGRLVDSTNTILASEVAFTFIASAYSHIQMRCIKVDPSGRPSVRTDTDRTTANGCN